MTIIDDRDAVERLYTLDFPLKRQMVRTVKCRDARGDPLRVGQAIGPPDFPAVEIRQRRQASRVPPGIEA